MRQPWIPLVAALLAAGCKTSYAYHYEPHPLEVHVQSGEETPPFARVMITALGGVRTDGDAPRFEQRFRVRIENRSDVPIALDEDELGLVDGDLRSFGPARVEPSPPPPVPPGEESTVEIFVAFPEGIDPDDLDLWNLNLRWGLAVEDRKHLFGSNFVRVRPGRPYEPYYGPHFGVFIGGSVHHH